MQSTIISRTDFLRAEAGWEWSTDGIPNLQATAEGLLVDCGHEGTTPAEPPASTEILVDGPGVHTRNGDTIELVFRLLAGSRGKLRFGFAGGFEWAIAEISFEDGSVRLLTSECDRVQPVASGAALLRGNRSSGAVETEIHRLMMEKQEGSGSLVKLADLTVTLDGLTVLKAPGLNVLPEMGVQISVTAARVLLQRFIHRGTPPSVPEHLHVGGWQIPNRPLLAENLASLKRGIKRAVESGVELLLTPETGLTGLFPNHAATSDAGAIQEAEGDLRRALAGTPGAPFLVVGLPVWENGIRYNASRVYDPDGGIHYTLRKIHSCEPDFHHGLHYGEFDIKGAPVCMHICHDGRYPDVWTVPVMFGARLILHPSNGGSVCGSIDAFEQTAKASTVTSHAFYLHVNGDGGSYVAGPQKHDNLIAVSPECRRESPSFPSTGTPEEALFHANLRLWDAFGYWPVRAFRCSEETASAYAALHRAMGGRGISDPAGVVRI